MEPLVAQIAPEWLFAAGCALLTYTLMRRSYKYFGSGRGRRSAPHLERVPRPEGPWDGMPRDAAAHIERQKVELYEMSRELNGELASRIVILEQLIAQSSEQITQMETLLDEMRRAEAATAAE